MEIFMRRIDHIVLILLIVRIAVIVPTVQAVTAVMGHIHPDTAHIHPVIVHTLPDHILQAQEAPLHPAVSIM